MSTITPPDSSTRAFKMSNSTDAAKPYASRDAFLTHGMFESPLDTTLDCSICREPLAVASGRPQCTAPQIAAPPAAFLPHVTVNKEAAGVCTETTDNQVDDFNKTTQPDDYFVPESAVRILPCQHIFGRACLTAWFTTSHSNRCPECNQELLPNRYMRLFLREPTRAMRIGFADYIDETCGDSETAEEIRANLMSDWTRSLIRSFAIELLRQQGYEVEYQYVRGGAAEEEADDEDGEMTERNDGDSYGMETDGGDDEEGQPKEHDCTINKH